MTLPWAPILEGVAKLADDLITTDEERDKVRLADRMLDVQLLQGQIDTNKVEAAHPSIFVAGARPAVIWVGVAGLAYQFVAYPGLTWIWRLAQAQGYIDHSFDPPPILETEALFVLLSAVLGLSTVRTVEKLKGVARDNLTK